MKTTVVGMLVMTAMAAAMGSAFAQETAKAAPVTFNEVARAITALAKKDRQAAIKLLSDFG